MKFQKIKKPLILLIIGAVLVIIASVFKILHLGVGFFQPDKLLLLGGIIEVIAAIYFMIILFREIRK